MAFYSRGRRPLAEEEKSIDAAKARTRAMELLAGQELSSGQLYERLNRRYTQQTSAAVVAEMVQRSISTMPAMPRPVPTPCWRQKRAAAPLPRICGRRAWPQARSSRRWMLLHPDVSGEARSWKPLPLWWKGITAKSWKRAAGIWSLRPCSGGDFRIPLLRKPFAGWRRGNNPLSQSLRLCQLPRRGKLFRSKS